MTEAYRRQYMTHDDYCAMCGGFPYYEVYDGVVEAETPEEAYTKAKVVFAGYVINEYVRTVAEYEAEQKEIAEWEAEKERKEAEKKARKEARENAKREAMHMTEAEYKAFTKHQQKIKRYGYDIKRMEREIAVLQEEIKYKKDWIRNNI